MGLSLGLLGALGGAAQAGEDEWKDDQKRKNDLNDAETRASFAETLQEKLQERKLQLAQQYPQYTHFVTDSVTGDTRGYTPGGQVATLSAGDPAQKQLYEATRDATIAQKNAAVQTAVGNQSLIAPKSALLGAEADRARAQADKARNPASHDKPMSAAAYQTTLMMGAHEKDPGAFAPATFAETMSPDAAQKKAERRQAAINAAKADLDTKGVHINEGLLQPPQEADGNDFMNAGSDDLDNPSNPVNM